MLMSQTNFPKLEMTPDTAVLQKTTADAGWLQTATADEYIHIDSLKSNTQDQ